ncbi:hypothetical protein NA57DRAFT_74768 [Rhizodiscina lignyota]|uniref:Integral membrane protein n=1 Tax=Rhizodiscina lignyota TaxID=1504668 RepID=A0A9P4M618_9PEZI|nr:hypothetical protein NA57DRAFT_74768 [Rhizodiscina lignyota]
MVADAPSSDPHPSAIRYILGFLLVGMAWGLTTPFMRLASIKEEQQRKAATASGLPSEQPIEGSWLKRKTVAIYRGVVGLLKRPGYLIPLVINLTGSVWFFLLVGKAELSLTVPITNSLAFLFTVLGEWWAEGKVIARDTWIGIALVLGGIALCVHSKTS